MPKIALVHDELIRRGGAEIVFEEMVKLFPKADVFALYSGGPELKLDGLTKPIHTSFLQRFPKWFRRHPARMLPWLPQAAEQFDFSEYDVVISSASAFAKGIVTRPHVLHICYCHTPTRYLWELKRNNVFLHYLRLVDFAAAQRVDVWLANSRYTQERIRKYYRQESLVVYPPIDTQFFLPEPRQREYFLVVGRRSASKRFDIARAFCNKLNLPLVDTHGGRSREELRRLYRGARALLQPGVEDFGMAAVEALACGTPVIAQDAGGVKEIVESGRHGILYEGESVEGLAEGMRQFLEKEGQFEVSALRERAGQFSTDRFRRAMRERVAEIWERRHT